MKTGAVLLQELRRALDEPAPVKWPDETLYDHLRDGVLESCMVLKASNQRWHVRVLNTASAALDIYGVSYVPATSLAVASGLNTLTLPRDCVEILHVYPENQVDRDESYDFSPSTLPLPRFDQLALTTNTENQRAFLYTFQGQSLRFAPALNRAMDFELHYVFAPSDITADSDVDQIAEWAYPAVKMYAKYLAFQDISHPDTFSIYRAWEALTKRLQSYAQPRTSQRPVIVQGIWEEDDYYDYSPFR